MRKLLFPALCALFLVLALQRSRTAREAIAVMHALVQEYGYNSTGESFAVCDKDEAWIMEMIGDLREAQSELEDFYAADQKEVEAHVAGLTRAEQVAYLTGKTEAYADRMMQRWDKLAKLLIVKHNDQIVKP